MKNFNVKNETVLTSEFDWGSEQQKINGQGSERIYVTRDLRELPKYVAQAISDAGYVATKIGYTTYKHSTWGLWPK